MGSDSLEPIVIVNCSLNAPSMLISIIGNTLVLAAILRTPSLRSPSTVFLCSLALSDLLVGIFVQPSYIANELTNDFLLFKITNITTSSVCAVSLVTMTAISVDRFLALHYHMRYPNLMTTHRALYTSALLWLYAFCLSLITLWDMQVYSFATAFSTIICLLLSTVCYIRIYRIVRQHQLEIQVQQHAVESLCAEHDQNMLRSTKSAINTFIFYIVMIICYTPLFIYLIMLGIPHIRLTKEWSLTQTVAFMNSSINPFLYCWRLRDLQTAVIKTAKQMLQRIRINRV